MPLFVVAWLQFFIRKVLSLETPIWDPQILMSICVLENSSKQKQLSMQLVSTGEKY